MHEFMLNIDNKEILNEILHHSVDHYLIGCKDDAVIAKSSHKYGFANTEDFESALKLIAITYKFYVAKGQSDAELLQNFSHLGQDLQQSVLDVVKARRNEIALFLIREHGSKNGKLLESFDWDLRFVMGSSHLPSDRSTLVNLLFNCLNSNGEKSSLHFEMDTDYLEKLIEDLENCEKALDGAPENAIVALNINEETNFL